ncbi:hypothetical protein ALC62_06183 [Cyphomyrmex costatus]|uniref:Uncharacterized protein n=1 Tax=Cyphomyrmex costatus TaxID=456900 RepID=A0A151IJL4_9HYME|nr:hypothetical protein ALC62_06183 [Cyphomyrmex costatus]
MVKTIESGYVKADSNNLPKIDMFMVCEYIKQDDRFNAAEVRGSKNAQSSRETYGDNAVGYVRLIRNNNQCIIKADICPEHKVRQKLYSVTIIVNEEDESVQSIECHECAASSVGSRHNFILKSRKLFMLSIHQLLIDSCKTRGNSAEDFLQLAKTEMPIEYCCEVEKATRDQSNCSLWYELRYGRITASKIYEAAHCQTSNARRNLEDWAFPTLHLPSIVNEQTTASTTISNLEDIDVQHNLTSQLPSIVTEQDTASTTISEDIDVHHPVVMPMPKCKQVNVQSSLSNQVYRKKLRQLKRLLYKKKIKIRKYSKKN